jgi:hypothetical protein
MSECNVCLIGDNSGDGEFAQVFERTIVKKSRKPHRCCECKREIPVGSGYEKTFMVFDGTAESFSACLICAEIRDTYYCADDSSPIVGELWTDIAEENFFAAFNTVCLSKLRTPEAKAYMLERWQKWKGLRA